MIICKECGCDVYIQQRKLVANQAYNFSDDEPYYCWKCEDFKDYNEVTYTK